MKIRVPRNTAVPEDHGLSRPRPCLVVDASSGLFRIVTFCHVIKAAFTSMTQNSAFLMRVCNKFLAIFVWGFLVLAQSITQMDVTTCVLVYFPFLFLFLFLAFEIFCEINVWKLLLTVSRILRTSYSSVDASSVLSAIS